MADNLTPFDSSTPVASTPEKGLRGFLNSKPGKLIIGGAVVVVLAGVVGYIAMGFLGSQQPEPVVTTVSPKPASVTSVATTEATVPEDVELDDVFTYRDVFEPTIVLVSTNTSSTTSNSTSTSTSNSNSTTTPANTLVLEDITTADGQTVAVFGWNGETYTLKEGESIPDTPWKVLEINESSVVMLYGDQRVTLSVGVGISK